MWLIGLSALAAAIYCAFYAVFCISNKNPLAAAAALLLTLAPVAVFSLCVLARVGVL